MDRPTVGDFRDGQGETEFARGITSVMLHEVYLPKPRALLRAFEVAHDRDEGLDVGLGRLRAARPFDAGPRLFLAQEAVDGGGAYPSQFLADPVRHGEPWLPRDGIDVRPYERRQQLPALTAERLPDGDEGVQNLVVVDPLVDPSPAARVGGLEFRPADRAAFALVGKQVDCVFPPVPGLLDEGVEYRGLFTLPDFSVLAGGYPRQLSSFFQSQLHGLCSGKLGYRYCLPFPWFDFSREAWPR